MKNLYSHLRNPSPMNLMICGALIIALMGPARLLAGTGPVTLSRGGNHFVETATGAVFRPWGFNYDHDASGRLLEDYWELSWPVVVEDFREMKVLGANVVRIHLQLGRFMHAPDQLNQSALQQLRRVVRLAENIGLYLNITGLGCYHKAEVPGWYDALVESKRWMVQALFWESVAEVCRDSPAIFCYDLMNEPILPGKDKVETDWLAGAFAGKHFVQRISLDLRGRTRAEVARAWVDQMVKAIRQQDTNHLVTVGVIPWSYTFPGAKPIFYAPEVGKNLDFVSVHFYPETGHLNKALDALKVYDVGKPLVVEEIFPLRCDTETLGRFMGEARDMVDGWIGFYWGRTIEEYGLETTDLAGALTRGWLEFFLEQGPDMKASSVRP